MRDWTIRQRILASLGLILLLMIGMGANSVIRMIRVEEHVVRLQKDSMLGVYYSTQLEVALLESFALTERFLAEDNKTEKAQVYERLLENQRRQVALGPQYESTIFTSKDRELFEAFKKARDHYLPIQADIIKQPTSKARDGEGKRHDALETSIEKALTAARAIVLFNKSNSDIAQQNITQDLSRAKNVIIGGIVLAVVLALGCGYLLFRAITRPMQGLLGAVEVLRQGDFTQRIPVASRDEFGALAIGFNRMSDELTSLVGQIQKSGSQVTTSVTEVAATSKQQQTTASEIASTTSEIGAASKEIWATSKELVKTMDEVSSVAEQSAVLAGNGQNGLSQMEETMRRVVEAAGSINTKLAVLNEKAGNISQVVTTITKVADQTNLLSLNAAIEAEKAGEHGKGFSVVATEIRRLADQTAVATYDIEQMVKEIQSAVSAGVMGMDKFSEEVRRGMQEVQHVGGQLQEIIQQVQALAPRFESVNEGMQAQATGAEQISEALMQLSEATQQTVDSLRQSNAAIEDLNLVASVLLGGVSRFKLQV